VQRGTKKKSNGVTTDPAKPDFKTAADPGAARKRKGGTISPELDIWMKKLTLIKKTE